MSPAAHGSAERRTSRSLISVCVSGDRRLGAFLVTGRSSSGSRWRLSSPRWNELFGRNGSGTASGAPASASSSEPFRVAADAHEVPLDRRCRRTRVRRGELVRCAIAAGSGASGNFVVVRSHGVVVQFWSKTHRCWQDRINTCLSTRSICPRGQDMPPARS